MVAMLISEHQRVMSDGKRRMKQNLDAGECVATCVELFSAGDGCRMQSSPYRKIQAILVIKDYYTSDWKAPTDSSIVCSCLPSTCHAYRFGAGCLEYLYHRCPISRAHELRG